MSRVFAFKCKNCGRRELWPWYDTEFRCENESCPPGTMVRDYKAENVGLNRENIRATKEGSK